MFKDVKEIQGKAVCIPTSGDVATTIFHHATIHGKNT